MLNLLRKFSIVFACVLIVTAPALAQVNHIVISQIYGGGGNTGAPYTTDFIELFNPTATAVDLSNYKIGYAASSTGNYGGSATLSGTIQPGQFFLIRGASGSVGSALPTPDFTTTINLSATTGVVVLVPASTSLTNAVCPTNATDLVEFGTGAYVCREGSANAPTLSNTTAALRTNVCTDTDNNGADFSSGAPNPRNSSTPLSICSTTGTTNPTGSGTASPNTVISGQTSTTLLVTVTPGAVPASTGISVIGDLSAVGGSGTQIFTSTSATTYSYTFTPTTSTSGAVSIPFTIRDDQRRLGNGSISLTVVQPAPPVAIHTVIGSRPLNPTGIPVSPYAGQRVQVTGVVTGIGSAGYFIQAPDSSADADPTTPEGVYVFTSSAPPASTIAIGNLVAVTGTVATYPAVTASHTPATEITNSVATLVAQSQPLPTAIPITASMLTPSGGLYQMARYEGMRVSFAGLSVVSGTDGNLSNEASATVTSNGQFYAVLPGTPSPVREPGIDIRDAAVPNTPPNVAKFDDNPERLLIDSTFFGGTPMEVASGSGVLGLTGVVDMTYSADSFYDPARILVDTSYVPATYSTASTTQYAVGGGTGRFSVAAYNVERMFDSDSSNNKYYDPVSQTVKNSSAVNLTATAFDNRITKIARGILVNLGAPDVVALEEVENKGVAQAIATKISSLASSMSLPDPGYVGYGVSVADGTYTSDVGGISTGFLVKPSTVNVLSTTQVGQNETFNSPVDNSVTTLNDRPAFVLKAGIKRSAAKDFPVTIIVNHLRSLSGISDASNYTRYKKELQARSLANIIQAAQTNGERVISVGDYNAFEFSDGYTDTLGTVTGRVLPADQVVQPGTLITVPAATDLVTTTTGTHSYNYLGNQQSLDHIVVTSNLLPALSSYMAVNINSDYPQSLYSDPTSSFRASDHDPIISYYNTPAPVANGTITPSSLSFPAAIVGTPSSGQQVVITNTGERSLAVVNIGVTGDFAATAGPGCTTDIPVSQTCAINVTFTPTAGGARTGALTLPTNGGPTFTVALSGTGIAQVVTGTLTPGGGIFPATNVGVSAAAQTFTLTNTGNVPLAVTSVSAAAPFSAVSSCPASVAVGANCTISVQFKPSALGSASGSLSVVTAGGTYTSTLVGTGVQPDYTVNGSSSAAVSLSVSAGSTATLPLTFTSTNGFSGTVTIGCTYTTPAPGIVCNVPPAFTLTGTSTQNVTFTTTTRNVSSGLALSNRNGLTIALSLAFGGMVFFFAGRTRRFARHAGLLLVLLGVCFAATGCGNSAPSTNPYGTPAGAYTYTVTSTATSTTGTVSHSTVVTLTVQ